VAVRGVLVLLLIACGIGALLPPFCTHGACTAEFDAVSGLLETALPRIRTAPAAREFLAAHGMAYQALSSQQCAAVRPREVERCPSGELLLGAVPVANRVCRYYRDESVRFQLAFNLNSQLIHIQTDMHPYRMLRFPMTDFELDFAK
jgi:hypothetical protein